MTTTTGWAEEFDAIIFGGLEKDWTVEVRYSEKERELKAFIAEILAIQKREIRDSLKKLTHVDEHSSSNLGMKSKHNVVHWNDITKLLDESSSL